MRVTSDSSQEIAFAPKRVGERLYLAEQSAGSEVSSCCSCSISTRTR
ncbi:hypothetical protein M3147_10630 [Agromyces mediolanus]|nr:hypothetical protein [Agromyces mediolanus]MCM3657706.1 hypothetical protein [Agromyces mediolanus]